MVAIKSFCLSTFALLALAQATPLQKRADTTLKTSVTQVSTVTPTVYVTITKTDGAPGVASTSSHKPASKNLHKSVVAQQNVMASSAPPVSTKIPVSSSKPSQTASSSKPGASGTGSHTGDGTFYSTGLGACGVTNKDSDHIVAIGKGLYDSKKDSSNVSSYCGKKIRAHYGGKSVEVTVQDRCVGCDDNSLDFSPSAFKEIASEDLGRVKITWDWVN